MGVSLSDDEPGQEADMLEGSGRILPEMEFDFLLKCMHQWGCCELGLRSDFPFGQDWLTATYG